MALGPSALGMWSLKDIGPLGKSLVFSFSLLYLINYFYRRIILYRSNSRGSIDIDDDKIDDLNMKPNPFT